MKCGWVVLAIPLLISCIQEMDTFRKAEKVLVIDGSITDRKGVHVVKVNYTRSFNTPADFSEVSAANVEIVDDQGNRETLVYMGRDKYQTDSSFQGTIGRSYHIEVTLRDGRKYHSIDEQLLPVPDIQEAWYKREVVETLNEYNVMLKSSRIVFKITFKDDPAVRNYYRWRYRGTYQVFAPSAGNYDKDKVLNSTRCGYVNVKSNPHCWMTDLDHELLKVDSDEFFNGKQVDELLVAGLEIDRKFMIGYHAFVIQQSLTKNAYEYLNLISKQIGNKGTIFETVNHQIVGNIRSDDNPDELVLGYFAASAVVEKPVFVNGPDLPERFQPKDCSSDGGCTPVSCIDCTKVSSLSSNLKPSYWPL